MRWVPLLLLLGCVTGRPGGAPAGARATCPPAPVAPARAPVAALLDEATVKEKTHAFFDAVDRADLPGFQDVIGPSFVQHTLARFYDAKYLTARLQTRIDQHAPIRSRTWHEERVSLGGNVAVFMGESIEHVPADGDSPASDVDNWNQIVWAFDGSGWKVVTWTTRPGGPEAEREQWNTVLRHEVGFKVTVNQFLADWAKGKKPGLALDIATGQGRNAVYLATLGWKVTGIDISDQGLEMTRKAALARKVKVTTIEADIDTWDLGTAKWDLVTLIYAGSNHALIERIKPSIKTGGWFVVEFFGKETTAGTGIGGFSPGELARLFDGWKIETDEVVDGIADWGLKKSKVARFAAQKP